jgi:hypothetical protein
VLPPSKSYREDTLLTVYAYGYENKNLLLFTLPPAIALSDCMQTLKSSSGKILKTVEGFEKLKAWSEGYAALSKSMEDKDKIVKYIINQQEHQKKITFREEYEAFIKEMGKEFDVRN